MSFTQVPIAYNEEWYNTEEVLVWNVSKNTKPYDYHHCYVKLGPKHILKLEIAIKLE